MTASVFRAVTVLLAATALAGSAGARSAYASAGGYQPAVERTGGDQPRMLTPLVWRAGEGQDLRIDVARRHHRKLRPEVDAGSSSRHGHSKKKDEGASSSESPGTVTVRKGDTINAIARRVGTTPAAIMKANPDHRPRDLHPGDVLNLPASEEAASKPAKGRHGRRAAEEAADSGATPRKASKAEKTYVVKHGDTLYAISRKFDVSVDELRDLNGLGGGSRLHAGQKIKLARTEPEAPPEERTSRASRRSRQAAEAPSRRYAPPTRESSVGESAFDEARSVPPPQPVPPSAGAGAPAHPIPYTTLTGQAPPPPSPTYYPPPPPPPLPAAPAVAPPSYGPTATPLPPVASAPSTFAPSTPAPSAPLAEAPLGPTDAQVAAAGRGRFAWPVRGALLSGFGPKPGGQRNDGLDIGAPDGSAVRAAATGEVVYAGNLVPGFGNLVLVKHDDGWVTAYAHLSKTEVKIRDHVMQGSEIGTVGSSGGVDQPQLHFEVRYAPSPRERARPIDPALVLPAGQ